MKKGSVVDVTIEKMGYKGVGISRVSDDDGQTVLMVPNAIPGEECSVLVTKKKKNFAEGVRVKKLKASPKEISAPCPYFGVCGGCKWQHMSYADQLTYKHQFIEESLHHIGKITPGELLPILPSPEEYYYRNKIELSFGVVPYRAQESYHIDRQAAQEKGEKLASEEGMYLGFHGQGSFFKIVDIESCHLESPLANSILTVLRAFFKKKKLPAYSQRSHEGFLRHLIIREGKNSGEVMVNIMTNETEDYTAEFWEPLVEELLLLESDTAKFESILWSKHSGVSDVARSTDVTVLHGREYIFEKVGKYMFKISPFSFFQTNTKGAEVLYDLVAEFADLHGGETVVDLYSGTGTIGMYLASKAKKVYSVEIDENAVADARTNATLNGIMNIDFISGKVENEAARLLFESPDVIVLDPPRAGMHPGALAMLPKFKAQKIVYVSCNPTTLARDLQVLSKDYEVKRVRGVDMFPQTYHVETVAELIRRK
ncbi:23S rRNA (uracil(1939)-C(5))-methyltransferase RlmD [Candidatus Gracilibacteria bacterium CG17_big_fil_post_rev_8_21_14_2_50_48_13]|nr:MAG: 23S rRNA (uracil(1939)-C(5))-methyltransferase RlmD [Candidatus Gracilibacteria bacterium CG17_big_fil_post_rev_8_21_14_2_50_48_13]